MPKHSSSAAGRRPAVAQLLARTAGTPTSTRRTRARPVRGLFLNVATNGLAVLETLGLRERLLTDGHRAGRMVMWSRPARSSARCPTVRRASPSAAASSCGAASCTRCCARGPSGGVPTTYGARLVSIDQDATACAPRSRTGPSRRGPARRRRRHRLPDAPSSTRPPEPAYSGLVGSAASRGARSGADARDAALRLRRPLVLRLPRARRRHHLLVRQRHGARPGREGHARRPARRCTPTTRSRPADPAATTDELRPYPIDDLVGCRAGAAGGRRGRGRVHATSPSAGRGVARARGRGGPRRCPREPDPRPRSPPTRPHVAAHRAVVKYARPSTRRSDHQEPPRRGDPDAMMPMFLRRQPNDTRNDWLYNHAIPGFCSDRHATLGWVDAIRTLRPPGLASRPRRHRPGRPVGAMPSSRSTPTPGPWESLWVYDHFHTTPCRPRRRRTRRGR